MYTVHTSKREHVTPVLNSLHWLLVIYKSQYTILLYALKSPARYSSSVLRRTCCLFMATKPLFGRIGVSLLGRVRRYRQHVAWTRHWTYVATHHLALRCVGVRVTAVLGHSCRGIISHLSVCDYITPTTTSASGLRKETRPVVSNRMLLWELQELFRSFIWG